MSLQPSTRHELLNSMQNRLARIATARAIGLITLCVISALAVSNALSGATAARDRWGESHSVVVVTEAVEPGERIDESNSSTETWPGPLLPAGALARLPTDATANDRLFAGQPLLDVQLLGRGGTLPFASAGQVALPIPRGPAVVDAAAGDSVRLLIRSVGPTPMERADPTSSVLSGSSLLSGTVVDTDEERLTIAVAEADAATVGEAVLAGAIAVMFEQVGG
jgi:hypothetical protein